MKLQVLCVRLKTLRPPKDDLLRNIKAAKVFLREGDIVAVSSKVVSVGEGRTVPIRGTTKDDLVKHEARWYLDRIGRSGRRIMHTVTKNFLIASAGIDESNGNGYYVLWPEDSDRSARRLLAWFKKTYSIGQLGLIITDSHSVPLRRGVTGFALSWAGFNPLYDYRGEKDLFGRPFTFSQTNIVDALAAAAVLMMGEGAEGTPLAIIRGAPHVFKSRRLPAATNAAQAGGGSHSSLRVPIREDLFTPFLLGVRWKKGKGN